MAALPHRLRLAPETACLQAQAQKRRKQVDRRASKGRRLRFDVQDKLVNFCTAVEMPQHIASQQILQNLFGQRQKWTQA